MFEGCRQDIPGAQHPASMAAETAQSKGRLATEVIRNAESACYEQIGARAVANDVPDSKSNPGLFRFRRFVFLPELCSVLRAHPGDHFP
jgi:hypothetical protein